MLYFLGLIFGSDATRQLANPEPPLAKLGVSAAVPSSNCAVSDRDPPGLLRQTAGRLGSQTGRSDVATRAPCLVTASNLQPD